MRKDNFIILPKQTRLNAFTETATKKALPAVAVEKDWWVTAVLRALFALPYAGNLSFKGGTALSKCYNLIERFSEDIDIAIDREYLGFSGVLSKTQINDRLRRAACSFVREKLQFEVAKELENQGIKSDLFSVNVNITPISTLGESGRERRRENVIQKKEYNPTVKRESSRHEKTILPDTLNIK